MTKEQKQQLLQDMLSGKAQPQSPVQSFLVGNISKLTGQLGQAQQNLENAQLVCVRIAGARDEHVSCLAALLGCGVDDPPMPGPPEATPAGPPRDWFDNGSGPSDAPAVAPSTADKEPAP